MVADVNTLSFLKPLLHISAALPGYEIIDAASLIQGEELKQAGEAGREAELLFINHH